MQLSGLVVGGIGIWTVVAKHSYVSLMSTSTYPTLAYALIVAGVLAVIGSWLGCGGVTSENRCILLVVSPRIITLLYRLTPISQILIRSKWHSGNRYPLILLRVINFTRLINQKLIPLYYSFSYITYMRLIITIVHQSSPRPNCINRLLETNVK